MILTKREKMIFEDALECLTYHILHDEYEYNMEELYALNEKIKNGFIVYVSKFDNSI